MSIMRKCFISLVVFFAVTVACQSNKPAPLTDVQKLNLYATRDKANVGLAKTQALPIWDKYQKAQAAQKAAQDQLDAITNEIKATPEGKEYIKAADDYAAAIRAVLKDVDQSKWKLGDGYNWEEITATPAPKAASDKK